MADDFKSRGWPLHVLLNNAGIQAPFGHGGQKTPGGFEVQGLRCLPRFHT
jgi:hypothetical protein